MYQATEKNEHRHGSTDKKVNAPGFHTGIPALGVPTETKGPCQAIDRKPTKVVRFRDCILDQRHASTASLGHHQDAARNPVPADDDTLLRKPLLFLAKQQKFKRIETILTFTKAPDSATWLEDFRPAKNSAGLQGACNGTTMLHMILQYKPPVSLVNLLILKLSELYQGFVPEDAVDVRGRTPLHLAVQYYCDPSVIQRLISGRMSSAPAVTKDYWGRLPLHWACENSQGHKYNGWRLLACGSRSEQCSIMSAEIIEILLTVYPHAVTVKDCKGCTPLDLALENGADHETVLLLDHVNRKLSADSPSTSANTGNESESEIVDAPISFAKGTGCQPNTNIEDDMSSIGSGGVSRHHRKLNRTGKPWMFCRLQI
jgi:ankyrin repeat protein